MVRTRVGGLACALAVTGSFAVHSEGQAPPLPPVPVPAANQITEPKRLLGKILFWDEQLSSDSTVACGTCHISGNAGGDPRIARNPGSDLVFNTADDVFGSLGVRRMDENGDYKEDAVFGLATQVTRRSAQLVIGSQWAPLAFWDGRASGQFVDPESGAVVIPNGGALESQALAPILSDVEMGHEDRDWSQVVAKLEASEPLALATDLPLDLAAGLAGDPSYPDLFEDAFGDPSVSSRRIAFAIATYERTLVPDQTPWDAFNGGNTAAMTPNQVAGWNFFRTNQCNICHAAPIFTNSTFRNVGLRPVAEDTGRQEVTGNLADRGRFKVPTLRNTGLKVRWMHNGALTSLAQVLDFYQPVNGQVQFPNNQDPLIPPINIPPQVRPQLIDFLANGLTDPRVANEQFPFDRPTLHGEVLVDAAVLADCLEGPDMAPAPTPPTTVSQCLERFDADQDADVDMADAAGFQRVY